ncbi:hypothetical protein ONS96_012493 [Cadophora gregata f. sp. sojae]|nr:hypothetical protein ONS96_012493 [Cadophora gregata f. sp. sojae]
MLEAALADVGITFTTLSDPKNASRNLKKFQDDKCTKALLMLTGDETASGRKYS